MAGQLDLNICRLCNENIGVTSLFDSVEAGIPLSAIVMYCVKVTIEQGDGLPANICKCCEDALEAAYRFALKCEQTDHQFRGLQLALKLEHEEVEHGEDLEHDARHELKPEVKVKIEALDNGDNFESCYNIFEDHCDFPPLNDITKDVPKVKTKQKDITEDIPKMPLTAAEKQKKYREKLKNENSEKYKETQRKAKERSARYYEKKRSTYTEEDKQKLRQKWKEDRNKKKDLQVAPQNELSISQASNSKQGNNQLMICRNRHRRVEYRLKQENAQLQSRTNTVFKTLKNHQKKMIRQQKKLDKMQEYCDNIVTKLNAEKKIEDLIHTQEFEEETPRKRVIEFINNAIPNIETPKKEEIQNKLIEHDEY